MLLKLFVTGLVGMSFLFGSVDFNSATKQELMNIKGIGEKKAEAILTYRKTHEIKTADDLSMVKGFGPKLISKIKKENSK